MMAYVEKVCHIFRYVFISINKTSRLGPLYFAEVGVLMKKINKKIFKRIAVVSAAVAVCAGVVLAPTGIWKEILYRRSAQCRAISR